MVRLRPFGASARQTLVAALLAFGLMAPVSTYAQVKNWPSERQPRPIQSRDVKFTPYAFKTLANGLQVIAV